MKGVLPLLSQMCTFDTFSPDSSTHFDLTRHLWNIKCWLTLFVSVAAVWVFEHACHRLYSTAIWYERHHHCIHTLRKKHFHQLANHLHIDWKRLWGYIFNRDSLSRGSCVTQWPHVWHTSLRYSVWRLLVITQQNSFWLALNESSNWKHNEFLCQTVDDKLFSQLSNRRK